MDDRDQFLENLAIATGAERDDGVDVVTAAQRLLGNPSKKTIYRWVVGMEAVIAEADVSQRSAILAVFNAGLRIGKALDESERLEKSLHG